MDWCPVTVINAEHYVRVMREREWYNLLGVECWRSLWRYTLSEYLRSFQPRG